MAEKKVTEKDCYLELERICRLLTETVIEDDAEFIKTARCSLGGVLYNLGKVRLEKARLKEAKDAERYAEKMWGCLRR